MSTRIEHGGEAHGILSVSAPRETTVEDARDLFGEVADDIAHALSLIEPMFLI